MIVIEVDINVSEQNVKLISIVDNLEVVFKCIINYCLMFEGGVL